MLRRPIVREAAIIGVIKLWTRQIPSRPTEKQCTSALEKKPTRISETPSRIMTKLWTNYSLSSLCRYVQWPIYSYFLQIKSKVEWFIWWSKTKWFAPQSIIYSVFGDVASIIISSNLHQYHPSNHRSHNDKIEISEVYLKWTLACMESSFLRCQYVIMGILNFIATTLSLRNTFS